MPNARDQHDRDDRATLSGRLSASSFDADKRTVDVVWYTGAAVERYDWRTGQIYMLSFAMTDEAADLSVLNKGAPALLDHAAYSRGLFGKIVPGSARLEGGKGVATILFTRREEMQGFVQDVADGILCNLSMGTDLLQTERTENANGPDEVLCTSWRPYELSFVPVAADMDTETLAREGLPPAPPASEGEPMPNANKPQPTAATVEALDASKIGALVEAKVAAAVDAKVAERLAEVEGRRSERLQALTVAVAALGIASTDPTVASLAANDKLSADEARAELLASFAADADKSPTRSQRRPTVTGEHLDAVKAGFREALLHRSQPAAGLAPKAALSDAGRHFAGRGRVVSMCREYLSQAGDPAARLSDAEIIKIALKSDEGLCREHLSMATGDLPLLLADVMHNSLQRAYEEAPATWQAFCRQGNVNDLRAHYTTKLGDAPDLLDIAEGAPYTLGSFGEDRESVRVTKRGRIISFTEEMMINDDLDGLGKFPAAFGRAARRLESDTVYSLITSNPTMNDGNAVFSAAHRNVITAGSGAAPSSAANLNTLIKLMRKQRTLSGNEMTIPAYGILVPEDLRLQVMQTIGDIAPATPGNLTPGEFKRLIMVSDQRLDDADNAAGDDPAVRWWCFGDPAVFDTIRWAYLNGHEGLQTSQRVGFDVDGIDLKAKLYFGAGWIDHRAFAQNAGK